MRPKWTAGEIRALLREFIWSDDEQAMAREVLTALLERRTVVDWDNDAEPCTECGEVEIHAAWCEHDVDLDHECGDHRRVTCGKCGEQGCPDCQQCRCPPDVRDYLQPEVQR